MFVNQLQTLSGIKFPLDFSKELFEVFPVSFNVILHGEICPHIFLEALHIDPFIFSCLHLVPSIRAGNLYGGPFWSAEMCRPYE